MIHRNPERNASAVESKDAGSYRLLPVVHATELLALIYQRLLFLFGYATYQFHWVKVSQLARRRRAN